MIVMVLNDVHYTFLLKNLTFTWGETPEPIVHLSLPQTLQKTQIIIICFEASALRICTTTSHDVCFVHFKLKSNNTAVTGRPV